MSTTRRRTGVGPRREAPEACSRRTIPEPPTLWDDYANAHRRAAREQQQRVFDDLTRRDLKLEPPPDLKAKELGKQWGVKPTEVEIEVDGRRRR
jgi:hypothetical protein